MPPRKKAEQPAQSLSADLLPSTSDHPTGRDIAAEPRALARPCRLSQKGRPRFLKSQQLSQPPHKINLLKSSSFTISLSRSRTYWRVIVTRFSFKSGASKLISSNTFSRIV